MGWQCGVTKTIRGPGRLEARAAEADGGRGGGALTGRLAIVEGPRQAPKIRHRKSRDPFLLFFL